MRIEHILFPVDFSARSQATAPMVMAMAERFRARVTLFSAAPPLWQAVLGDPGGAVVVDLEKIQRDLEARLAGTFAEVFAGIGAERVVEVGDPARAIVDFAHAHAVDLIMMPTHGYGPFRELLLGSVTAKVLHDARCPVWTSAHTTEPDAAAHVPGRTILCAVDGSPEGAALIVWARQYADATGGSLRVVHALTGVAGLPETYASPEFDLALRAQAQETIGGQIAQSGVDAPLCISVGEVPAVVRDEAERHNADLVVIGRGKLHETMGRLRTQANAIIRQSPCPVLSV